MKTWSIKYLVAHIYKELLACNLQPTEVYVEWTLQVVQLDSIRVSELCSTVNAKLSEYEGIFRLFEE